MDVAVDDAGLSDSGVAQHDDFVVPRGVDNFLFVGGREGDLVCLLIKVKP